MVTATQHEQLRYSNCWRDPVVGAMLQKGQRIAVALLVSGNLHKLDPTTGDSSCQVRALLILVLYHHLRKEIGPTEWEEAVELSREYLQLHGVKKNGDSIKNAHQVKKSANPYEEGAHAGGGDIDHMQFQDFVTLVHKKLGEQRFELLGLAYSLWSGGIVSTDEFWIDFRYRSNNLWGQHERLLRARLAKLSCAAMIDLASELPVAGKKWAELLRETKSVIKRGGDTESQHDAEDVEVLCAQSTFNVALAILYQYNIPIVDGNIRIQLNGANCCDHGEDHSLRYGHDRPLHRTEMNNTTASCKIASCKMTYSLGTVRTLLYVPNKMTGAFEYVRSPSKEQMMMPCFFLKSWSTYYNHSSTNSNNRSNIRKEGGYKDRDNLYTPDHNRYYEALIKMDKSWAIEVMASTHPSFTRRAQNAGLDIAPVYERIFGRSHKEFRYNRYGIEGENYLTPDECQHQQQKQQQQQQEQDQRPTPTDRLMNARQVSHEYHLSGECQFVRMGAPSRECTWRITQAIDWNVVHVHAATYRWVNEQLQALACRHQEAPGAVIGRYVFSQGFVGASHECQEAATKLHNTHQSNTRMTRYLADYPRNQPLLRR